MKKKHLVMIMIGIFVCGLCMSGYMLRNGFAKADEAPVTEVQIDDGFVVVLDNDAETIETFNNQVQVTNVVESEDDIAETEVIPEATVKKDDAQD